MSPPDPTPSDEGAAARASAAEREGSNAVREALAILNAIDDAVFIFDAERLEYRFVNQGATKQTGFREEELLGKSPLDLKPLFDREEFRELLEPLVRGERNALRFETLHRHKEGHHVAVEVNLQLNRTLCRDPHFIAVVRDSEERNATERALRESEARFKDFASAASDFFWEMGPDLRMTYFSGQWAERTGISDQQALGQRCAEIGEVEEGSAAWRAYQADLAAHRPFKDVRYPLRRDDGELLHISLSGVPVFDDDGGFQGYRAAGRDITERVRGQEQQRLAASVIDSVTESIMVTDPEGVILSVNNAFSEVTGFSAEQAVGKTPSILRSEHHDPLFYRDMWAAIDREGRWSGEVWNRRADGEVFAAWLNITAIEGDDGVVSHYVGVFSDITDRKRSEERIQHLAHYDPLTDLPNRLLFTDRCERALGLARRRGELAALLFIDLDRFKPINDTLGHPVGDRILQGVAGRLICNLRESDTVARLGGDEFVVLLEGMNDVEDAGRVAQILIDALNQSFTVKERELHLGASVGIALFGRDGDDVNTLIKNADTAMYRAKSGGRNAYEYCTPSM